MNSVNKFGLGRGLEALLGDDNVALEDNSSSIDTFLNNTVFKAENKNEIPLEKIERCSFQPRTEFDEEALQALSASIKEKGVLQPILVRAKGDKYEIVAGERRFKAAMLAGLTTIPAIVRKLNDSETLEIALIENIQRENLNAIEEAKGLNRLLDEYGHTQDNLSKVIGKSRTYIANSLRLLTLPEKVKNLIKQGKLSSGHARALVGLENAAELADIIIEKSLSVRQTEKLAAENKLKPIKIRYVQPTDYQLVSIMNDLGKKLGMQVKISAGKKGNGTVVLKYENPAQFSKLLDILEQR
jgi:ParB family chromosome partitioning protein